MDLGLGGKGAVVTGGSSGIGLATVRQFLADSCRVALCARNEERLATVVSELEQAYGSEHVASFAGSFLNESDMADLAQCVEQRFGGADILIANAGQGRVSTFSNTSDEAWTEELDLKFFSQIYPIRAFQSLLNNNANASIVGVNSPLAYQPEPHMVATAAARAGVQNLLKSLASELAPVIRVNSILLGVVHSGQWERRFATREDKSQSREAWFAEQPAAQRAALSAPSGPVSLEIPVDIQRALLPVASPAQGVSMARICAADSQIDALAEWVLVAKRPMLWLGGDARDAHDAAKALMDAGFAAVTSTNGQGVVDDSHPASLGAFNMNPQAAAIYAQADLLIVVGSRLRGNQTRDYRLPLPPIVQIDADAAQGGAQLCG